MLVLSRKTRERIVIRDRETKRVLATVDVVEIRPDHKVRLGITAPNDVEIHRQEVIETIDAARDGKEADAA